MKKIVLIIGCFILTVLSMSAQKSFYDLQAVTIDGKKFEFSGLKGKKVMVVNTASRCGFTPQYKDLERLYQLYGGFKFEIVAFPSNDFMGQEPGTNEEIQKFCSANYNVTFPMMAKIAVKDQKIDPVYKWLTDKSLNGVADSKIKWNFQKYLIDEKGNLIKELDSKITPMDTVVTNWLKN